MGVPRLVLGTQHTTWAAESSAPYSSIPVLAGAPNAPCGSRSPVGCNGLVLSRGLETTHGTDRPRRKTHIGAGVLARNGVDPRECRWDLIDSTTVSHQAGGVGGFQCYSASGLDSSSPSSTERALGRDMQTVPVVHNHPSNNRRDRDPRHFCTSAAEKGSTQQD